MKEALYTYRFSTPGPSFLRYNVDTGRMDMYFAVMKKQKLKSSQSKQVNAESHLCISTFNFFRHFELLQELLEYSLSEAEFLENMILCHTAVSTQRVKECLLHKQEET